MKELRPAFEKNNVAIVLASSAYYAPYMAITIQSIIMYSSEDHNYDINILNREIETADRETISKLAGAAHNISIRYIDVDQELAGLNYNYREGYAPESFYRVLMPYFLPHYEKVLYLDSDVIAVEDVARLYETDVTGYLTAAVRDPDGIKCYFQNYHDRQLYMDQVLQLNDPTDYFQSGVMLFNLEEFRNRYKIDELTGAACNPEIVWGDQDVLNLLCRGKVKHLDASWNTIVDGYKGRVRDVHEWAPGWIYESYMEARRAPKIVHYAGVQPWKDPKVDMNEYFWPVAEKSPYYKTVLRRIEENKKLPQKKPLSVCGYPYIISVIVPIYNAEEYLRETLESVVEQTIGFEKNIQLILVNNATQDNSESICLEYKDKYPNNVQYIKLEENVGPMGGRAAGLTSATGKYINFLDADDKWRSDAFEAAVTFFENHYFEIDLLACRIYRFGAFEKWDVNDGKFSQTRILNVSVDYDSLLQSMCSVIFKASTVKNIPWNYNITHAEDGAFLTSTILRRNQYGVCREAVFCYRKRGDRSSLLDTRSNDKKWYFETTEKGYIQLINECVSTYGTVPLYAQSFLVEEMVERLRTPLSYVLSEEEIVHYRTLISDVVKYINDYVIWNKKRLNKEEKYFLCYLKYDSDFWRMLQIVKGKLYFNNIETYCFVWKSSIMVEMMDIHDDVLRIRGKVNIPFPADRYSLYAQTNRGKWYELELTDHISGADLKLYLGEPFLPARYFDVSVPLTYVNRIKFYIHIDGQVYPLGFYMDKFARCATEYSASYRKLGSYLIKPRGEELRILPASKKEHMKSELAFCTQLLKRNKKKALVWRVIVDLLRCLGMYRHVWLVTDRKAMAGDSGECFFRYVSANGTGNAKVYFVISKSSPKWDELRKIGRVVDTDSHKHKLLFMMAEHIISSLTNDWTFDLMPYHKKELYDLLRFDFTHIQHGVIKDDISSSINLFNKNIRLFVTSGEREYQSLLEYPYGYSEREVRLTGLPRLDAVQDGISAAKGKVILIAPTWRRYLRGPFEHEKDAFGYNEQFKESDYYRFYNDLINDPRLLECAKKNGYMIKFRLHPVMDGQISDFTENGAVQIESVKGAYHTEMLETSLLVTDYSSIAFDYAYLYTPVIYTQFDKEEFEANHSYTSGYYDYERDGFGPVCGDYESTVNAIISAIGNGCVMEEKYHKRAEEFFAFRDGKNCERIYQEVLKLDQEA